MILLQLCCHPVNEYETSVFTSCARVANRRRHLTNEMKDNGGRPKKTTFSAPHAVHPPAITTHQNATHSVWDRPPSLSKISVICLAVSEEMHRKQARPKQTQTINLIFPNPDYDGGDIK